MPALAHVDASRPAGSARRWYAAFATTRFARFVSRHVNWKLDRVLLRLTGGRLATTLMIRAGLLETTGARTGLRRTNAVIYWHDGDRVTIAASQAGAPGNPHWFYNLVANPRVRFAGHSMRAEVVSDPDEVDRLWALGDRVFPAFRRFRDDAAADGRHVPLIQLLSDDGG